MSRARDKANSTVSNFASTGIDDNADANAITIDSSENVLVGTTNTDPAFNNVAGQSMAASGQFQVTRDGGTAALFNRKSSNGEIVSFRKDSTTVGSIGTSSSRLHIENGDTGLRIAGDLDQIFPCGSGGGDRDAAIDLGSTGVRFKDLYLSGGAYIGGTGSANKLDDYEEGTFTPTFTQGFNSPAFNTQTGRYTKIGNRVFFELQLDKSSGAANTSHVYVGGLPFNSAGDPSGAAYFGYNGGFEGSAMTLRVLTGTNQIALYRYSDGGAVGGNDIDDSAADLIISGFYAVA